jgi:rhamnosyltransferase
MMPGIHAHVETPIEPCPRSGGEQSGALLPKIISVVVTYFPDWVRLYERLERLATQVEDIVLIDNGPSDVGDQAMALEPYKCHRISLGDNYGIARAQNAGMDWAIAQGATHVMLLDQDSDPAPDMVDRLLEAVAEIARHGEKPAVIAPRFQDERMEKLAPFFVVDGLRVASRWCAEGEKYVPIDAAIASGSLLAAETLKAVGGMREELFVDFVDMEWCMRARSLGYQSYGVCDAVLHHSLGESPRSLLGRKVAHHSPLRSYYFVRNAVWLMRQGCVPLAWKLAVGRQLTLRYLFYGFTVAPRLAYVRMMTLGVLHGLRGRLGRLD